MANNGAYIEIDGEKQYIKRELRFLRHSSPFNTRDDAKAYIESEVAADNINSDYAQPVVVRYIDAGGEQIILGIGKGDNGYHFIDSAAIEHDLKAIIASVGTGDEGYDLVYDDKKLLSVKDQLSEINLLIQNGDETTSFDADHTIAAKIDEILEFIKNAVTSVGLNEDGTMGEFVSDEYVAKRKKRRSQRRSHPRSCAAGQGMAHRADRHDKRERPAHTFLQPRCHC